MLKQIMFRGTAKIDDRSICIGSYTITNFNPPWKHTLKELEGKKIKVLITVEGED